AHPFQPVLVQVHVQSVGLRLRVAVLPQVSLMKTDHIQRPAWQSVPAVGQLLGVAEVTMDTLDPARLAANVGWSSDMTTLVQPQHPNAVSRRKHQIQETPHVCSSSASLRSISSRERMPFSASSCSVPTIQRS